MQCHSYARASSDGAAVRVNAVDHGDEIVVRVLLAIGLSAYSPHSLDAVVVLSEMECKKVKLSKKERLKPHCR